MVTASSWRLPILLLALPLAAAAHDPAGHTHGAPAPSGPRGAHLETGCAKPSQQRFDRGFYLLHNMDYTRARAAFEQGAAADPACAMLAWGAAMTYFQPLWPGKPNEAALAKGGQAAAAARAAARSEADRGYAAAVSAFYEGEGIDYGLRLKHWAAGQRQLAEQRPDDVEAQAFFQLSRLAARDRKDKTYAESLAAAHEIERLLQLRPDHPGLMHYLVHAYDNPGLAQQGVDVSKQYMATSPDTAHALHMPSHIYTRLGDWPRMIDANRRSAAAALTHPTADKRVSRDFLHATDYLVYGQLQTGDDRAAAATAARIDPATPYEENFGAGAYALAAVPARLALERRDFAGAAKLAPRAVPYNWDMFPWAEAVTHAARGLGAARSGDAATARAELAELERLQARIDAPWWAERVGIEHDAIAAWLAWNDHDAARAEALMSAAAARETAAGKDSVEPGHVIAAVEEWGDLLLELGRPQEALAVFEASLRESPNRFNALLGAANAAALAGQQEQARAYYRQLLQTAGKASTRPGLANARRYLAGNK